MRFTPVAEPHIVRWSDQTGSRHESHASNGPTEAADNLTKRSERVTFGFRRCRTYRIRTPPYGCEPDLDLRATINPRRNPKCRESSVDDHEAHLGGLSNRGRMSLALLVCRKVSVSLRLARRSGNLQELDSPT